LIKKALKKDQNKVKVVANGKKEKKMIKIALKKEQKKFKVVANSMKKATKGKNSTLKKAGIKITLKKTIPQKVKVSDKKTKKITKTKKVPTKTAVKAAIKDAITPIKKALTFLKSHVHPVSVINKTISTTAIVQETNSVSVTIKTI